MCHHSKKDLLRFPLMALFGLATVLTVSACQPSSEPSNDNIDTSSSASSEMMSSQSSENVQSSVSSQATSQASADTMESCEAQSCGEEGSEVTCLRENGCICGDAGCMACRNKNETCTISADCCGGLGLECQGVTLTDGSTEKRCLTVLENVCTVGCTADGTWTAPSRCRNDQAPEDTPDCDDLSDTCMPPTTGERNERLCIKS